MINLETVSADIHRRGSCRDEVVSLIVWEAYAERPKQYSIM